MKFSRGHQCKQIFLSLVWRKFFFQSNNRRKSTKTKRGNKNATTKGDLSKQPRNKTFRTTGRWTRKQKWQCKWLQMKMITYIMWTWSNNENEHTKISNDNIHDANLSEERSTKSSNDQRMLRNVRYWQREGLMIRTTETTTGK